MRHVALLVSALFIGSNSSAEWKEETLSETISKDSAEIAIHLGWVPQLTDHLLRINLASPEKITVSELKRTTSRFTWVNDSKCSVPDATQVDPIELGYGTAKFYHSGNPNTSIQLSMKPLILPPCSNSDRANRVDFKIARE